MNTPTEDLAYIRAMIDRNRGAYGADSRPLAAWGALVAIGSISELAVNKLLPRFDPLWIWIAVVAGGWAISIFMIARNRRRQGAETLATRAVLHLWLGVWTAMTLAGFGGAHFGDLGGSNLIAVLCAMLGIGYFAGASLVDDRRSYILASAWWGASLSAMLMPHEGALIVLAAGMLLLQVWPAMAYARRPA